MRMIMPITYILWITSEILLAILKRSPNSGDSDKDKSSLRLLWSTIIISIVFGVFFGMRHTGHIFSVARIMAFTGLCLIWVGLIIRWIAILTLRRYFTVNVAIAGDHKIIDSGLYGYIRHPAYLGSLISFLGLGMTFANWLSILVIFIPITAAFLYRINIEEAALQAAFREKYSDYSTRTSRLLPGIY